jgi:hypothetical protein
MLIRFCKVGGYTFTFDVTRRRLIDVEAKNAYAEYWPALTGAIGLVFGIGKG